MRIGVNASRLAGQRLGVARYIEYLVKHWATQVETRDDVVLFLREPLRPGDPPLPERFGTSVLRPALTRLAWAFRRTSMAAMPHPARRQRQHRFRLHHRPV